MKSIRLWSAAAIAFGTTAVSGDIMQDLQRALAEYRSDPCQVQHCQAIYTLATIDPEPAVSEHAQAALARLMRPYTRYPKQQQWHTSDQDQSRALADTVPSLLPAGFRDDFTAPWFYRDRSAEYFKDQFDAKLRSVGVSTGDERARAYERAEMRCWWRYDSCEFRDFLQTLPVYQEYIVAIAEALTKDAAFAQSVANACSAQSVDWIHAEAYRIGCARRAREIDERFKQDVHSIFSKQRALLDTDTQLFYKGTEGYTTARFTKRAQAAQLITAGGAHPTRQVYRMSSSAGQLLREFQIGGFNVCYGNELQQVIHQECIDLIERTAQLASASPIFAYQATLVHCIDAAQTYNRVGQTYNATTVADFCYTLLDYGTAVVEGARDGLLSIAHTAIQNPLETATSVTLSVAAGEYMLAYQLGKLVYGLLDLTVNAVINPEHAQKTWDGYIEPLSGLVDALKNRQLSLRDGIRAGTALAVQMKAQAMLAKGCERLYSVAKAGALEYITKNPLAHPEQYMEMGNNFACKLPNNRKVEWTQYRNKHKPPKNVNWKEVVKQTKHGYAKYKPEINREKLERMAWDKGTPVANGRTWRVMKADYIVGAKNGEETPYVRVEMSANTIHGHPITRAEYRKLLKNEQS